ncbi:S-adenosyl-L-methionine-dependent methyltransferase [Aspergillus navahoensis]
MPSQPDIENVQRTLDRHIEAGNTRQHRSPWDKQTHNPSLEEVLTTKRAIICGPLSTNTSDSSTPKRKKALVPGCGRGVDDFLLASFGYDAYGLEYSKSAIEQCKKEEQGAEVPCIEGNHFDFIYDYTFFCALPRSLRPPWATRHTQLRPGEDIEYDAKGRCKSDPLRAPSELGLERVAHWQPAKTHDLGLSQEGDVLDQVSIWGRQ